jgi:DNA mismatch endonuclease (patch repair protein)
MIVLPNGITMAQLGPSKNTRPERVVRMHLVRLGLRHRRNHRGLPGTPDFWLYRDRVAVLVYGVFWHHPVNSNMLRMSAFWREKLRRNVNRDRRDRRRLRALGITPVVV